MNRLYIIIIVILCCADMPVTIAGDIVRHYDEHHNITGYTTSEETRDTHYDIEQNRIGHTDWDNNDTGRHYDKNHNRTGYSGFTKEKEIFFDGR